MTAIVGIVDSGKVWIGGDSAGVDGSQRIHVRRDVKVFHRGPFLIGYTSSFRMGQLLRFSLNVPARHPETDIYEFMTTAFVNAVRDCLKAGGYARKINDVESGGQFLVGFNGRLFFVANDFQVGESADDYDACGCGLDIAFGSLWSTKGRPPDERIRVALEAAEKFNANIRGPF